MLEMATRRRSRSIRVGTSHHRYVIDFRDYPLCRDALNPPEQIPMRDLAAANRPEGQGIGSWADATDDQRSKWLQRGRVPPDYPRPVAADWPDLLAIIARRVQPARASVKRPVHRLRWWQHADKRPALYRAIAGLKRVLACIIHEARASVTDGA